MLVDNENKIITVYDENNKEMKVQLLFTFEVEEFQKKYMAYALLNNEEADMTSVMISELTASNTVKTINKDEIETVVKMYDEICDSLIGE